VEKIIETVGKILKGLEYMKIIFKAGKKPPGRKNYSGKLQYLKQTALESGWKCCETGSSR
jgi:hypothetical protein